MSDKHYLANLGSVGLVELRIVVLLEDDTIQWEWRGVDLDDGRQIAGSGGAPMLGTSLDDVLMAVAESLAVQS